jgi:hypothetical protein
MNTIHRRHGNIKQDFIVIVYLNIYCCPFICSNFTLHYAFWNVYKMEHFCHKLERIVLGQNLYCIMGNGLWLTMYVFYVTLTLFPWRHFIFTYLNRYQSYVWNCRFWRIKVYCFNGERMERDLDANGVKERKKERKKEKREWRIYMWRKWFPIDYQ